VRGAGVATGRATATLRVRPAPARLTVRKRTETVAARSGQAVRYRLTVTAAASGVAARGVRLCDEPGEGLHLLSAPGGARSAARACWQLGTLAPGRTVARTAVAVVEAPAGVVRNVARASASNVAGGAARASAAHVRVAAARSPVACAFEAGPPPMAGC
jgi:hypothetical protein